MRKATILGLGLVVIIGVVGRASAQTGFGGLSDTMKKAAGDAAKQEIDKAVGATGAADKAANPRAAAKDAADAQGTEMNNRARNAADGAAQDSMGGARRGAEK